MGLPPTTIGRYRILSQLASDATGEVFKGFDPMIERPVVVKVFDLERLVDPSLVASITPQFYREMNRIGVLVHPGIAPLFDAGECGGTLFMATEFVDGSTLADVLATTGRPDPLTSLSLLTQAVAALEYARGHGVSHLHLKPSQVMMTADSTVKVAGFGVAAVVDAIRAVSSCDLRVRSRYDAPERARGETGDQRSDVYSVTQLVLDLFAEVPGDDANQTSARHSLPDALAARGVAADRWTSLLARGLAPHPAERFDTPRMLLSAVLALCGVDEPAAPLAWEPLGGDRTPRDPNGGNAETVLAPNSGHDDWTTSTSGTPYPLAIHESPAAEGLHARGRDNDDLPGTITRM